MEKNIRLISANRPCLLRELVISSFTEPSGNRIVA